MDEIFDEWVEKKGQVGFSYHIYFEDWWKSDLLSMIYRDRNHPSIVIWSAGNEVPDQVKDNGLKNLWCTFSPTGTGREMKAKLFL